MSRVITLDEQEKQVEKMKRLFERKGEYEELKELKKIVAEFNNEERNNCHSEIYFWKKVSMFLRYKMEITTYVKIRLRELEREFKLSEEEELIRFWIAEILYDFKIIDELSSDIATEWLLESQECEIKLVRRDRKKWLEV